MPPGKLAAQAGHAFTDSLMACLRERPDAVRDYMARVNGGSKAVLKARNLVTLERAAHECMALGLPHALITDSGHVLPPHFDGTPVVTALGIGPVSRQEAKATVKRFRCV